MGIFIIGFIGLIGASYCAYKITSKHSNNIDRGSYLFGFMFAFTLFSTAVTAAFDSIKVNPTALDVYRGKTELRIDKTFRNDTILVKCDSIVVFKNVE